VIETEEDALVVDGAAEDDFEFIDELLFEKAACAKATTAQTAQVNLGNTKKGDFLDNCGRITGGSPWVSSWFVPIRAVLTPSIAPMDKIRCISRFIPTPTPGSMPIRRSIW
jgi:hypothetical protein